MLPNELKRLIVVHPYKEYDPGEVCRERINTAIRTFPGSDEHILVIGGHRVQDQTTTGKHLVPYFDDDIALESQVEGLHPDRVCKVAYSDDGGIEYDELDGIVMDGVEIELIGGSVDECHRRAFEAILDYIDTRTVRDVSIVIPYGKGYLKNRCNGSIELHYIKVNGRTYEIPSVPSITLMDVSWLSFHRMSGVAASGVAHMENDCWGLPIRTTPVVQQYNVRGFLEGYFDREGEPIVDGRYIKDVGAEQMRVTFLRD